VRTGQRSITSKFRQRWWNKAIPAGNEENGMDLVFMRSPEGEVKEAEATTEKLTILMASGWHQVPAPVTAQKPVVVAEEEK
jgi:uncharacterized protein YhjY with autotransporter beta-barrel domain